MPYRYPIHATMMYTVFAIIISTTLSYHDRISVPPTDIVCRHCRGNIATFAWWFNVVNIETPQLKTPFWCRSSRDIVSAECDTRSIQLANTKDIIARIATTYNHMVAISDDFHHVHVVIVNIPSLLNKSITLISDCINSAFGLITCETTNLDWSWSRRRRM